MKSKTYTGEYSLKHWIQLMLKGNIVLPEYQRSFVWNEKDVERLILSLKSGQFIQPVTIARMNSTGNEGNYILDGQQRLTSLLLFALGYFPLRHFFESDFSFANEDDSSTEETDPESESNLPIGWTFHSCMHTDKVQNTLERIKHRLAGDQRYKTLEFSNPECNMVDEDLDKFLENRFLGFSYIVPENASKEDEQKFFSTLFRNMNYLGKKLSPMESRRSLYYLHESLHDYFEGKTDDNTNIFSGIRILENFVPHNLDVVRYLSLLSQYHITHNVKSVMVGYSAYSSRESYYVDYVSYILGLEQEGRTNKFNGFDFKATLETCWQSRFKDIAHTLASLKDRLGLDAKSGAFQSWIDADYWLFGLIYWILFQGKTIAVDDDAISEMRNEIKGKRDDPHYATNSNRITNIRDRLRYSIEFFEKYVEEP